MKRLIAIVLALVLLTGAAAVGLRLTHHKGMFVWAEDAAAGHANALWHIVHELCTPDMKANGNPAPCVSVDLTGGFAVLKDIQGKTQYLLIPTARVTGIESPELLAPDSPNYWAAAWEVRKLVQARIGHAVPREDIGLAVNSVAGRTQNQLHIHVDCVGEAVHDELRDDEGRIGPRWSPITLGRHGHHYHARWLAGDDLDPQQDPFKILAATIPTARDHMGDESLAVIGATRANGAPGFVLLQDAGNGGDDVGAAEELLDHSCKIANQPPAPAG
jgi:CDP-diacylglycerol pyrophosphatase